MALYTANALASMSVVRSEPRTTRILAISGSLREGSSNTALLRGAIALSPKNVEMKLYSGLSSLPHFSPDLEATLPSVAMLRSHISWSDGLIISSPEYAHGVPGALKNALDWLVGGEEFAGKPVALFNASPRATYAQASLIEIVTTMAGRVVPDAAITVSLLGRKLDAEGIVNDAEISRELKVAIASFIAAIKQSI